MPSFQQLQYRMYLRRGVYLFLFLAVASGLYFGLVSQAGQNFLDRVRDIGKIEIEKEDTSEELGLNDFDKFLARASTQQLITKSTELVDDPTKEVLIRLDQQQRKERIADRLLDRKDDQRATNVGISNKLDAMRTALMIKFDNGLADAESISNLKLYSTMHANNEVDLVDKQASLSRATALLIGEMSAEASDEFEFTDQSALEFKNTCRRFRDNEYVADQLFELLQRIYIHTPKTQQAKFSKYFSDGYKKSNLASLRKLSEEVDGRLVESEFELISIFDSVVTLRADAVEKLRGQILKAFETGFVSNAGYQRIFSAIRDVARFGDYDTAIELSESLQNEIASRSALKKLEAKNQKLRQQLKLIGQRIPENILVDFDGAPYQFPFPDAKVRATCFMPKEAFKKSDQLIFKIMRVAGKFVSSKQFSLTAVYVDYGDSPDALAEVQKMGELISIVDFCRLDANSPDGKQFVEQLAMIDPPMLVLHDAQGKIASIDVTDEDFYGRFFELMK